MGTYIFPGCRIDSLNNKHIDNIYVIAGTCKHFFKRHRQYNRIHSIPSIIGGIPDIQPLQTTPSLYTDKNKNKNKGKTAKNNDRPRNAIGGEI